MAKKIPNIIVVPGASDAEPFLIKSDTEVKVLCVDLSESGIDPTLDLRAKDVEDFAGMGGATCFSYHVKPEEDTKKFNEDFAVGWVEASLEEAVTKVDE